MSGTVKFWARILRMTFSSAGFSIGTFLEARMVTPMPIRMRRTVATGTLVCRLISVEPRLLGGR